MPSTPIPSGRSKESPAASRRHGTPTAYTPLAVGVPPYLSDGEGVEATNLPHPMNNTGCDDTNRLASAGAGDPFSHASFNSQPGGQHPNAR